MSSTALTTMVVGPSLDPLALIQRSERAESTKSQYIRALQPYLDRGGSLADTESLRAYANSLGKSRRAHLRSALSLWAKALTQRLEEQVTPENLAKVQAATMRLRALPRLIEVEKVKGQKAHTWLSARQVRELIATCGDGIAGLRDRVVLGLLVGAGLRRQELADLTWENVKTQPVGDKVRTVLEVTGKGSKTRIVPISDRLAMILDEWATWTGRDGRIVRSLGMVQEIGKSLDPASIFRIVRKHGKMIGVPELAAHDLRRTYAQLGFAAGVPITQVSILLGHSSVAVTQRYLNLDLDLECTASDFVPFG